MSLGKPVIIAVVCDECDGWCQIETQDDRTIACPVCRGFGTYNQEVPS